MLVLQSRLPLFALALLTAQAGINLTDEPAAKGKESPGAVIQLDQAKTLRLGKLLENLHVLTELKIDDDVFARLEDVKDQQRAAERQQMDEFSREMRAAQDLPAAQRAERLRPFLQTHQAARNASAETVAIRRFGLLTGPQMERLNQLDLQDQGIGAFFTDEVAGALKLSADQQQQIETIQSTYEAKFRPLLKGPIYTEAIVLRSTQPAMIELLKERTAKVEQVLSKEQLEKLAALRGKPFDLSRMGRALGEIMDRDLTPPRLSPMVQNLLSFDAVRKDLKLTPEEEAGIDAAIAKHRNAILDRGRLLLANKQEADKLSAVQRALKREEEMVNRLQEFRKNEKELTDELGKYLKDSHLTRLKQIHYQRGARHALFEARNELGLSTDQMEKITAIQLELHNPAKPLPPLPQNFDELKVLQANQFDRRKKLQEKEDAKFLEILTPEQRQKLKELQGPPFDVSLLDGPPIRPARISPPASKPLTEEKPKQP
jgi:hypothetical protein